MTQQGKYPRKTPFNNLEIFILRKTQKDRGIIGWKMGNADLVPILSQTPYLPTLININIQENEIHFTESRLKATIVIEFLING